VIVGDAHKIELPDVGRARAGQVRLRGLRLVHTHLKPDPVDRDDLTDLALLRLDLVAALHARDDGLPGQIWWAHLLPENDGGDLWRIEEARDVHHALDWPALTQLQALEDQLAASSKRVRDVEGRERAILVGLSTGDRFETEARLNELRELARTAGVDVADVVIQTRRRPDPRYVVGRGKIADINLRAMQSLVEVIIFDVDLAPSQARAIAEVTNVKILDRTQLILDIFAQRAQSNEGKIQVELAQLRYTMPRLQARDDSLSRLTGGIGGRGPGETKLEVDRRRVRDRIARLERELKSIATARQTRRSRRNRRGLPTISIIGYTNAGKSTLLNALTRSEVLAEDKLFATLDPTSRRLRFPDEREVLITDTVGFIRELPKDLKAAFKATLEELEDADLLLHVVDGADPDHTAQVAAVEGILRELGVIDRPRLLVFNKADRVENGAAAHLAAARDGVAVSALAREGFDDLLRRAGAMLFREGATPQVQMSLADLA
jgi:GTPase